MLTYFLAGFAVIFAFGAALVAIYAAKAAQYAAQQADAARVYCQKNNKASKLARLEAEFTELVDSVHSIRESLHKLRSRIGMREVRARKKTAQTGAEEVEYPNTPEGRDAERAALERELTAAGKLNPRIHLTKG